MFCTKCGFNIGNTPTKFCERCGERLQEMPIKINTVNPICVNTVPAPLGNENKAVSSADIKAKVKECFSSKLFLFITTAFLLRVVADIVSIISGSTDAQLQQSITLSEYVPYGYAIIADIVIELIRVASNFLLAISLWVLYFAAKADDGYKKVKGFITLLMYTVAFKYVAVLLVFVKTIFGNTFSARLMNLIGDKDGVSLGVVDAIINAILVIVATVVFCFLIRSIVNVKNALSDKEVVKRPFLFLAIACFIGAYLCISQFVGVILDFLSVSELSWYHFGLISAAVSAAFYTLVGFLIIKLRRSIPCC